MRRHDDGVAGRKVLKGWQHLKVPNIPKCDMNSTEQGTKDKGGGGRKPQAENLFLLIALFAVVAVVAFSSSRAILLLLFFFFNKKILEIENISNRFQSATVSHMVS